MKQGPFQVDGLDMQGLARQNCVGSSVWSSGAWLYEGTIKDNLRFGNLDATDEQIVEAAKAANVDHFIRTLPGGFNMKDIDRISNISLGPAIAARALLADLRF